MSYLDFGTLSTFAMFKKLLSLFLRQATSTITVPAPSSSPLPTANVSCAGCYGVADIITYLAGQVAISDDVTSTQFIVTSTQFSFNQSEVIGSTAIPSQSFDIPATSGLVL